MGGKIVSEESRGKNFESQFHTLCYQNQMGNMCPDTSPSLQRKSSKMDFKNIFSGSAKSWHPAF